VPHSVQNLIKRLNYSVKSCKRAFESAGMLQKQILAGHLQQAGIAFETTVVEE